MSTAPTRRKGRGRAKATLNLIETIVGIASEIQPCSVRAIAYQMFNRKLIGSMSKGNVQKVSRLCVIAREEGALPWEWLVDESRQEQRVSTWDDPTDYALTIQHSYRKNKWDVQPVHVAVWSEKSTIEGTLKPILKQYEVPYQPVHGWCSTTTAWDAAQASLDRSKRTVILYVGDFDPSGMGMSELDLPARLARYMTDDPSDKSIKVNEIAKILRDTQVEIRRIALTRQDTIDLGPGPSFPASDKQGNENKKGDSRYPWFVQNHGDWCWELDALPPPVLRSRVEDAIRAEIDFELWNRYTEVERVERNAIVSLCRNWTSILRQDQKRSDSPGQERDRP